MLMEPAAEFSGVCEDVCRLRGVFRQIVSDDSELLSMHEALSDGECELLQTAVKRT